MFSIDYGNCNFCVKIDIKITCIIYKMLIIINQGGIKSTQCLINNSIIIFIHLYYTLSLSSFC